MRDQTQDTNSGMKCKGCGGFISWSCPSLHYCATCLKPSAKDTQATLADLQAIRARADRLEVSHECPHYKDRKAYCDREPCGTMETVTQLRSLCNEIERLRRQRDDAVAFVKRWFPDAFVADLKEIFNAR